MDLPNLFNVDLENQVLARTFCRRRVICFRNFLGLETAIRHGTAEDFGKTIRGLVVYRGNSVRWARNRSQSNECSQDMMSVASSSFFPAVLSMFANM